MSRSYFLAKLKSSLSFLKFWKRSSVKKSPSAKSLLEQVEEQKKELQKDKEFNASFKKVEKSQRQVLEENPEFVKQLMALKESKGEDGNYDKALLAEVLQKTRQFCDNDVRMRLFLKQQQQKLAENKQLQEKIDSLAQLKQQVLQVA